MSLANRQCRLPLSERFELGYTPEPNSGYWLWTGHVAKFGYGYIGTNRKQVYAHRLSWEMVNGKIQDGMFVCHKCDVPQCVNPDHLFLGTQVDNMADMSSKDRGTKVCGVNHTRAKLTEDQVLAIYNASGSCAKIGSIYGIDKRQVWFIKAGKSWSQLTRGTRNNVALSS